MKTVALSSARGSSGSTRNLNCEWGCSFDEHCNESQAECGSDEMLSRLSTESCTDQGENRALTYVFWCSAQCSFLIGRSILVWVGPVQCSTPCWCGACYLFHSKMRAATHLPQAVWTRNRKAGDGSLKCFDADRTPLVVDDLGCVSGAPTTTSISPAGS